MIHIINENWSLKESSNLFIDCNRVYAYIKMKKLKPEAIDINLIAHKDIKNISKDSLRYIRANIDLPGIVVKGMENPFMKEYRMIDGRHRLLKNIEAGKKIISSYVLHREEILKFVHLL
jgi:hypothetical protein